MLGCSNNMTVFILLRVDGNLVSVQKTREKQSRERKEKKKYDCGREKIASVIRDRFANLVSCFPLRSPLLTRLIKSRDRIPICFSRSWTRSDHRVIIRFADITIRYHSLTGDTFHLFVTVELTRDLSRLTVI